MTLFSILRLQYKAARLKLAELNASQATSDAKVSQLTTDLQKLKQEVELLTPASGLHLTTEQSASAVEMLRQLGADRGLIKSFELLSSTGEVAPWDFNKGGSSDQKGRITDVEVRGLRQLVTRLQNELKATHMRKMGKKEVDPDTGLAKSLKYIALYDFRARPRIAEELSELTLNVGDIMTAHGPVRRDGTVEVTVHGVRGLVPRSFIEPLRCKHGCEHSSQKTRLLGMFAGDESGFGSMAAKILSMTDRPGRLHRARFDYEPDISASGQHISLRRGNVYQSTGTATQPDGFIAVNNLRGVRGLAPGAFMEPIERASLNIQHDLG